MFDFPNNPATNQVVLGTRGEAYVWDGWKWVAGTGPTPPPGTLYLPVEGGTMTGPLYYTATGSTASRSAQDRAADWVNVLDFYAPSNNWDTAFDAAFAALPTSGGTIVVPAGHYTWAVPHVWASKAVSLIGDGKGVTTIYISHTGIGLTVDQTAANMIFNHTNISDITFYAAAPSGPTQGALAIKYPFGANFPASFPRCTFTGFHIEMLSTGNAAPWGNCFLTGITLTANWMPKLIDIHFFGAPVNPGLAGSYAVGIYQGEDARIVQLYAQYGKAGVMILDHGEGIDVMNSTFVGTDWAIAVDPGATNFPAGPTFLLWNLIQATNCEMNCYLGVLNLRNTQQITVLNCDMTRFADSGSLRWVAIQLNDCCWATIRDNFVTGGGADITTNRYVKLTFTSWACFHNEIHNQVVPNQMQTYTEFSGSPNLGAYNGISWTNSGQVFADTANGGQAIKIGNNTALQFTDTGTGGVTVGVASDNHFAMYSDNGSSGSVYIWDFYTHTATPSQNFHIPTGFGGQVTIDNGVGVLFQDSTLAGTGINLLLGGDNHFGIYSANGSGGSVLVMDFYSRTPTPVVTFDVPTIQAGGTTIGYSSSTDTECKVVGASNAWRALSFWSGGTAAANQRWALGTLGGTESGSNSGSDFAINQFSDTGANLGQPFTISRATGAVQVWNGLGLFGHAPQTARPTVSGAKNSNSALASLIAALVSYGAITDSTTA